MAFPRVRSLAGKAQKYIYIFKKCPIPSLFVPIRSLYSPLFPSVSSVGNRQIAILSPCTPQGAVEMISDSLRLELAPWDISVSLIEPGYRDIFIYLFYCPRFPQALLSSCPQCVIYIALLDIARRSVRVWARL